MVLVSGLAPVAVLVMLRESAGSLAFVLTAVGLLAFWCGSILPSTFFAQPLYGGFMSWGLDAPPQDWGQARHRHFPAQLGDGGGAAAGRGWWQIGAAAWRR